MYKEHFDEHPEEYEGIRALKIQTKLYEIERQKRKEAKLKKIEECKKVLNGTNSIRRGE